MKAPWRVLLLAWMVSAIATLGALFIGEVMLMTPCTLCWYQRILMFPMAIILGMGSFSDDRRSAVYAMPFAVVGSGFAAYHCLLVANLVPKTWVPCSAGISCANQELAILGGVQIPWLSLSAFLTILVLLIHYLKKSSK
ncbi:disulfide bond formation protein B [Rhodoferax saidenbachensis]|uniref:Disulfide bond formation protein B n=1 Tax=Rhodoferax saidenbachensis TaxID=1484693 RepID=A0A1P8KA94_9BURK|nr:disulfide bond formation protein B [Rhodoferax saidenbachensis]APW42902.1 disulfide bond formation protein B [Rhodoferax saidenbachensis]